MNIRRQARLKRAKRSRKKLQALQATRLCVHRTPKHIYAQVIDAKGRVLTCATSVEKELQQKANYTGNIAMAKRIGSAIAERAQKIGIKHLSFDRSGFKYHGRIKALADAVREGGVEI